MYNWHGHSKLFLRKKLNSSDFDFSPAKSSQISLIKSWLQQDHMKVRNLFCKQPNQGPFLMVYLLF